jgi:hypothetical protein
MGLSPEELKRRIFAARVLRGLRQVDLQASLAEDGLGKRELGRIERGSLPLNRVRRETLARALRVPEIWFTSESVDEIVGTATPLREERTLPLPPGEIGRFGGDEPPTREDRTRSPNQKDTDSEQGDAG